MRTDSAGDTKPWTTEDGRTVSLQVALLKHVYILPWGQFLYAEGTGDEVKVAFATHDVVVKGGGLVSLLNDLAGQRVSLLREPTRGDKFVAGGGPRIVEVSVQKAD